MCVCVCVCVCVHELSVEVITIVVNYISRRLVRPLVVRAQPNRASGLCGSLPEHSLVSPSLGKKETD